MNTAQVKKLVIQMCDKVYLADVRSMEEFTKIVCDMWEDEAFEEIHSWTAKMTKVADEWYKDHMESHPELWNECYVESLAKELVKIKPNMSERNIKNAAVRVLNETKKLWLAGHMLNVLVKMRDSYRSN